MGSDNFFGGIDWFLRSIFFSFPLFFWTGDQYDRFFWNYNKDFCHVFYTSRPFTVVVSALVCILPFCYPKRIDFLKYPSAAGVISIIYIDALQMWKYYSGEYVADRGKIKYGPDRWTDVFLVGRSARALVFIVYVGLKLSICKN